jgi:hypothetical protein
VFDGYNGKNAEEALESLPILQSDKIVPGPNDNAASILAKLNKDLHSLDQPVYKYKWVGQWCFYVRIYKTSKEGPEIRHLCIGQTPSNSGKVLRIFIANPYDRQTSEILPDSGISSWSELDDVNDFGAQQSYTCQALRAWFNRLLKNETCGTVVWKRVGGDGPYVMDKEVKEDNTFRLWSKELQAEFEVYMKKIKDGYDRKVAEFKARFPTAAPSTS